MTEQRRVVLICTGQGAHGRVKLAQWGLDDRGQAVDLAPARQRPLIDAVRESRRDGLDVSCARCRTRRHIPAGGDVAVRNPRASHARMTEIVTAELARWTDRTRVVLDVSSPATASLF